MRSVHRQRPRQQAEEDRHDQLCGGLRVDPPRSADNYWYRISKAALNSAMRLLSVEFKDQGVLVVMFHPGGVRTEGFRNLKMAGLVPPEEAVGKMIKTIDGLTMNDTGRFLQNDGRDQPW